MIDAPIFEAHVNRSFAIPVIELHGDMNGDAKAAIDQAYEHAEASGAASIVIDFARVEYINSTGIALIVSLLTRARKKGLSLAACTLSSHYQQIFEITRLSQFIRMYPDVGAALDDVRLHQPLGE